MIRKAFRIIAAGAVLLARVLNYNARITSETEKPDNASN
jgi:hypothetical protein